MKCGYVYLIGAGPGDKGLITLKGLEALRKAEVVIYDSLAAPSLLNEAAPEAELIYAGKRAGRHYMKQDETNALLVQKALHEKKVVARLKGGDPFIFGRGGEEALVLRKNGIDFEIIPGISSSYAVAAYNGIPVTHRGLASSFHVITGHEDAKKENSVLDYETLAREEGTLIFLMGLNHLEHIAAALIANGKNPKTPAAVMQEGTTAGQKTVVSTLEDIAVAAKRAGIQTPAITLIGEVAKLKETLEWYSGKPLSGKRILVTASHAMTAELEAHITACGGEPLLMSLIETKPIHSKNIDDALTHLTDYSWIVLTSKNGVKIFFDTLKEKRIDVRQLAGTHFAVIGKGTAQALEEKGIYAECVPEIFSSHGLVKAWLPKLTKDDKVLLARAKEASKELTEALTQAEVEYTALAMYETVEDMRKAEELQRALQKVDYVTLCSASAVRAYVHMAGAAHAKIVCIGPVTEAAAKKAGLLVACTATKYDAKGVVECIVRDAAENTL